ncbi:protein kinase domain-containing protein [Streptomyces sp. NPDC054863]
MHRMHRAGRVNAPLLPEDPDRLGSVRLLGRLGAGGMGQVYVGRTAGGRLVAVKTVHAHLAAEPHYRERFRREAAAARAVTGAYTAAVLDADPDAAVPWLATAFLPGVTLRRTVAECGPLPVAAVRALGAALAEALAGIHAAGIVHRDLKPSNVLVTADGPRVIDFGIARLTESTHSAAALSALTAADDIIGTPGFIAPEQIEEGAEITSAADVFALGAVLAFASTGENPFGRGSVPVMLYRAVHEGPDLDEVPWEVRDLVARCLAKSPPERPEVREVLGALRESGTPLWWREGAVGELVLRSDQAPPVPEGASATTPGPDTARTESTAPAPVRKPWPSSPPPLNDSAERAARQQRRTPSPVDRKPALPAASRSTRPTRRQDLARRSLLTVAGGGVLGLLIWAGARAPARKPDEPPALDWELTKGTAAAGAVRWSRTAGTGTVDAILPTAGHGGMLLAHGSDGFGTTGGAVHALDTADGSRRWSFVAGKGVPQRWGIVDDTLVAPDAGVPGVRLADGKAVDGDVEGLVPIAPEWFLGVTAAGAGSGPGPHLVSYSSSDSKLGGPSWQRKETARWQLPVLAGRSLLLVAPDPALNPVTCVDVADGATRWRYGQLAEPVVATGTDGRRFHLLTTSGVLLVLDVRTGKRLAAPSLGLKPGAGASALSYAAGTGLAHAAGRLTGFDPADGQVRWQVATTALEGSWRPLPGGTGHAPPVDGNVTFHRPDRTTVQALGLADGKQRWRRTVEGGGAGQRPPVVAGGTLYAAAGSTCTALGLAGGSHIRTWGTTGTITDLTADTTGWYARLDRRTVQAVNRA